MSREKSRSLLALAGFGLATAGAAWYGSRSYRRNGDGDLWYRSLAKPKFTPPDAVFPIVWTSLYAMMAWSGWRVWSAAPSRERRKALRLWISQLSANAKWSKLFFGEHRPNARARRRNRAREHDLFLHESCPKGRSRGSERFYSLCCLGGICGCSELRNCAAQPWSRLARALPSAAMLK